MKNQRSISNDAGTSPVGILNPIPSTGVEGHILSEHLFNKIVRMEEKRAMRSNRPLILLVLDAEAVENAEERKAALASLAAVLPGTLRHTDVTGWCGQDASLGILMTEIGKTRPTVARQKVTSKIAEALEKENFPWADVINVTAQVVGNGAGASVETVQLGHVLSHQGGRGRQLAKPLARRPKPAYLRELLLVGCDALVVLLCSLLIFWPSPLSESLTDGRLVFNVCLSLLILLSVSLLFGFYKMERLWLARNKLRHIGISTGTVIGISLLWALFAPQLVFRPEIFLGQTLVVWALSLGWKFLYLRHYLRSEVDRVLSIQHHKAI